MMHAQRVPPLGYVGVGLGLTALVLLIPWPGSLVALFAGDLFHAHGVCYLWEPGLMWLHGVSDLLIGAAYVSISTTLAYLVYRARQDIPFHWVFLAFGTFIVACGSTHFMEVVTLWTPIYWLSGNVKIVTAIASVVTAALLPPLVPRVLRLVETAKQSERHRQDVELANLDLAAANQALREQIAARERAEAALHALNVELEQRVAERTRALQQTTEALQAAVTARDEFLAVAAHELRTPVTSLRLYAQLLNNRLKGQATVEVARVQPGLRTIDRQTDQLTRLVAQLLEVSRLDAGRLVLDPVSTDLRQLVAHVVERAELLTERHTLRLSAPAELSLVVDPLRIEQVVTNLLDNAIKYSPGGGPIDVELSQPAPDRVRLVVRDRGLGIPPERRGRLFERFYQAHTDGYFSGMGLGLFISHQIVELHGGRLWAEFPEDRGTAFVIELPAAPVAATD